MRIFNCILIAALFVSCATGVETAKKPGGAGANQGGLHQSEISNPYREFPTGADFYFSLKKEKGNANTAEFIDYFLTKYPATAKMKIGKREKKIIEKAGAIDLAFYKKRYTVKMSGGNFPSVSGAFYFMFSSVWKKVKVPGAGVYWQAKKSALSIAMNKNTVFVSNRGLFDNLFDEEKPVPDKNYAQWRNEAFVSGWIHQPKIFDSALEKAGVSVKIPAKELYILIFEEAGKYDCVFRVETQNASTAKAVAGMLMLAKNNFNEETMSRLKNRRIIELFFVNPPSIDGKSFVLKLPSLSKEEFFEIIESLSGGLI